MWTLLSIIAGVLFTEVVGHFLHRLLHSEKVPALSRSHMIHHLKHYGPKMNQRADGYKKSTEGRVSLGSIGMEWIIPIAIVLFPTAILLTLVGVSFGHQFVFWGTAIGWAVIGFSYMHDILHVKDNWLLKNRFLKKWFKKVRRLHDIHHSKFNDEGKMDSNFGITFFGIDRLLGTFARKTGRFNESGYNRSKDVYAYIYDE